MKLSLMAAITCGVWLSGIASAAALTYELKRPLMPLAPSTPEGALAAQIARTSDRTQKGARDILELPTVTIVGSVPSSAPPPARPLTTAPRDIAQMTCADWRSLDMGSGRVQVCD